MIVIDTNVLFDYLTESPGQDACQMLADIEPIWGIPNFWRAEFLNGLNTYVKAGKMSQSEALQLWNSARNLPRLREYPSNELQAFSLSVKYRTSVYDAFFLALAYELGVYLVTADKRLIAAAPQLAVHYLEYLKKP